MNDTNESGSKSQDDVNPFATLSSSPGAMLRNAREAAGVSIEALASAMKVSIGKIEGMETDNYTALPDVVFARALAASICRVFGMDAAPVLALMPKGGAHSLPSAAADINTAFRDASERPRRNSMLSQVTRPLGVAVVVLLLGAAVFVLLPYRNDMPESAGNESTIYEPGVKDVPLELNLPAEPLSGTTTPQSELPSLAGQQEVLSTQGLNQAQSGKPEEAIALQSTSSVLEFSARGPSWIQVRDANKKVVFERTLAKGENASATGALPLSVIVGRADVIDVKVRGNQFGLSDVAKSNVARFEVKE